MRCSALERFVEVTAREEMTVKDRDEEEGIPSRVLSSRPGDGHHPPPLNVEIRQEGKEDGHVFPPHCLLLVLLDLLVLLVLLVLFDLHDPQGTYSK